MPKERTPVPLEVSAEVLFLQDHTCCVCREPGKSVQLHHMDEDPTNHSISNIAVLCFDDHNRTQLRGGFGKQLLPAEVEKYRSDWTTRVAARRDWAGNMAASSIATTTRDESLGWSSPPRAQLIAYIDHLPALRKIAYQNAYGGWDTGITGEMRAATSEVIDIQEHVLNYLATWYPPDLFGPEGARKYFNDYVGSRYFWHRSLQEPEGPGSGGTIVGVLAGHGVTDDLSSLIEEMVGALAIGEIDTIKWRKRWRAAEKRSSPSLQKRFADIIRRFW